MKSHRHQIRVALDNYRTIRAWVAEANRGESILPRGLLLNMCKAAKAELREACTRAHIAIWQRRIDRCSFLKHQAW